MASRSWVLGGHLLEGKGRNVTKWKRRGNFRQGDVVKALWLKELVACRGLNRDTGPS